MKKLLTLITALLLATFLVASVCAADDITVIVNGCKVAYDVPPMIISDRTMVPMRATFEALGSNIEWVAEMSMVVATYGTNIISLRIGEPTFTVTDVMTNKTVVYTLDVPAQIVGDRTLIPLRAVSEALGKTVEWKGEIRTAIING